MGREDRLKEEAKQEIYWKKNDDFFQQNGHYPAREVTPPTPPTVDPLEGIQYDETGKIIPTADGRERERYDIPLYLKQSHILRDAASPVPAAQAFQEPEHIFVPPVKPLTPPAQESPVIVPPEKAPVPQVENPPAPEHPEQPVQETIFAPEPSEKQNSVERFRVVGEVLHTYIVVEHGDKMTLIDKHAAHERMHFDRLSAYRADAPGQLLLTPEVIRLSREDYQLVWDNLQSFEDLGYELEAFGDDALMLRSVPADIDPADGRACVEQLCESLRSGRAVTYEQVRQELLKTVACKAAIKAGRSSHPAELEVLAEAVLSGAVKYCPHGRPVSVTYTKTQLDKEFDRIV